MSAHDRFREALEDAYRGGYLDARGITDVPWRGYKREVQVAEAQAMAYAAIRAIAESLPDADGAR